MREIKEYLIPIVVALGVAAFLLWGLKKPAQEQTTPQPEIKSEEVKVELPDYSSEGKG